MSGKVKGWKPRVCGRCPKWARGWCYSFAKRRVAAHPACSFGAKKINSHDTAMRARKRRGVKVAKGCK